MNKDTRTKNSLTNIIVNFLYQFIIILISFFSRRIFIETLGVEYLGISGLFTNIIGILALAELGIGSAISYSMYKEIANNNTEKLKALTTYYKSLYNKIALIILVAGLALLPFLKYIVKLETEIDNIEIYYIINILNTVISYLFVYKTTIVTADQKEYKMKLINCILEVLKLFGQIFVLIQFKSYLLYLGMQMLFVLIGNIIRSNKATKWYPFIKEKAELSKEDKTNVWTNIKSMFCYKIGGVIQGNTDNILISMLVNTGMVGYYSNYTTILNKLDGIIGIFFNSITASIGNFNVLSKKEDKCKIFNVLTFFSGYLFLIACIGIYFVGEDVIIAMSGNTAFVLEKSILIISIILFYFRGMLYPILSFRTTTGLFKMAKYSTLMWALLNIIFSIIFGKIMGLFGIILATVVSLLMTNAWYEPYLLYKKFFNKSPMEYYIKHILRFVLIGIIILLMTPIMNLITIDHLYIRIIVKFILSLIIPNIIFILVYCRSEEFKYIVEKIKEILSGFSTWLKNKKEKSSN